MRILCVIPASISQRSGGKKELARRGRLLREYAADGTEIDLTDVPEGPTYLVFAHEEYLGVPPSMARIQEAANQGYDAAILGCFRDPGRWCVKITEALLSAGNRHSKRAFVSPNGDTGERAE
jgi:allantoin racemase